MPRHLLPTLIAFPHALQKGALIALPPPAAGAAGRGGAGAAGAGPSAAGAGGEAMTAPRMLRFQYNPETITRTRSGSWESRQTGQRGQGHPTRQDRASDAFRGGSLYAKSETLGM